LKRIAVVAALAIALTSMCARADEAQGALKKIVLADYQFAYEPLGLTLRRNDADFKFAVNQMLAGLYRSGEVKRIYSRWFGNLGSPPPPLDSLYDLNGLRD